MKNGFGPAVSGEPTVFGARRPEISRGGLENWLGFMERRGIRRLVCLLAPAQLADYRFPLMERYEAFFGAENTLWNPVQDFHPVPGGDLSNSIMPFLRESDNLKLPVVVHCQAGLGRTGIVLAAWLARARGFSPAEALEAVTNAGRRPLEVVEAGRATMDELLALVGGR